MQRHEQNYNQRDGSRGKQEVHRETPEFEIGATASTPATFLLACLLARGMPKCNELHNSDKPLQYGSFRWNGRGGAHFRWA
jgi:hypothetical protein